MIQSMIIYDNEIRISELVVVPANNKPLQRLMIVFALTDITLCKAMISFLVVLGIHTCNTHTRNGKVQR